MTWAQRSAHLLFPLALGGVAAGARAAVSQWGGALPADLGPGLGTALEGGLWLVSAVLFSRVLEVVLWDGLMPRLRGEGTPRLLKDMGFVACVVLALFGFVGMSLGKSLAGLWAASGVFGLVLGLALRPVILDVFGGLAVNFDRAMTLGDWVRVHVSGQDIVGEVLEISWRATKLRTEEKTLIIVPNSILSTVLVTNYSREGAGSRFETFFCLDFSVPVERARRVLLAATLAALRSGPGLLTEPRPQVLVHETEELGVVYKVRYWITPWKGTSPSRSRDRISTYVIAHLRAAGLSLAYPKRDVFTGQMPTRQLDSTSLEDRRTLLARVGLFEGLADDELTSLAAGLSNRLLPEGSSLISQGEPGASMFVLVEGLLEVFVGPEEHRRSVAVLEPGSFLGEMSLLTGEPRTATVTAHTEALVYELGKDALEPLLAARPALLEQLSVAIAARRLAMAASSEGGDAAAGEDDLATALLGRMRSFFADVFGRSH